MAYFSSGAAVAKPALVAPSISRLTHRSALLPWTSLVMAIWRTRALVTVSPWSASYICAKTFEVKKTRRHKAGRSSAGAASIKHASGVAVYPPSLAEPSRSPNCFNADARTSPCGPLLLSTLTRAVSIGWGPLSVFFTDGLGGVFYKSIPLPGSPSDITGSPDHKWLAVILRGRHRCVRRGFLHRRRVLSALLRLAAYRLANSGSLLRGFRSIRRVSCARRTDVTSAPLAAVRADDNWKIEACVYIEVPIRRVRSVRGVICLPGSCPAPRA